MNRTKKDIIFGIEQDVEYIAASFVRCAEDVEQIRAIFKKKTVAKILTLLQRLKTVKEYST